MVGRRADFFLLPFCFCLAASAALGADVLTLNDGLVVRGEIVRETDKVVVIKVKFGTVTYDRGEVKSIERGEDAAAARRALKSSQGAGAVASARAAEWRDEVALNSGEKFLGLLVSEGEKEVVSGSLARP